MNVSPRRVRILLGSLLVALIALLFACDVWIGRRVAISALVCAMGLVGWIEYARITGLAGRTAGTTARCLGVWGGAVVAGFLALAVHEGVSGRPVAAEWPAALLALTLLVGSAIIVLREDFLEAAPALLSLLAGVVMLGWLYSYILRIYHRGSPEMGLQLGAILFLGVKGTDISAYLVGSWIGRRRILEVSPKKSLEGFAAAHLFGSIWFGAAAWIWPATLPGGWVWFVLGALLAATSALGDLAESLLKRYHRVKDSGAILPEFGGVLDMIDSLLFSAVLFWCFLCIA